MGRDHFAEVSVTAIERLSLQRLSKTSLEQIGVEL
jgi:hypothetical protein